MGSWKVQMENRFFLALIYFNDLDSNISNAMCIKATILPYEITILIIVRNSQDLIFSIDRNWGITCTGSTKTDWSQGQTTGIRLVGNRYYLVSVKYNIVCLYFFSLYIMFWPTDHHQVIFTKHNIRRTQCKQHSSNMES